MMKCFYNNESFIPTRTNQKFANAKNRIRFHNEKRKEVMQARALIDTKLHKNYNILLELMDDYNNRDFHIEFLRGKGYSFGVLTHYQKFQNENHPALYDFLMIRKDGMLNIIRYD